MRSSPPAPRPHRTPPAGMLLVVALLTWGCSSGTGVEVDPAVEPIAGTWDATSVVLTNKADPDTSFDLIEQGGTFTLVIEKSGYYTAILTYLGQGGSEAGDLSVVGNVITLDPEQPADAPTTSGTFELQGTDTLIVDGETLFDFNLDGTDEEALVHFEFARR